MAAPAASDGREAMPSAWAPLAHPVFRMLWITWLVSNVCLWMNDVAAAWLMNSLTASPAMVALVQTASTLPVFLLGLPSGAAADILNRRRWFIATQFWVAFNAMVLAAVLIAGWLSPVLLLLLTFGNGIGLALRWPVYAAIVPELVPRRDLPAALALNGVAVNTSRIVGPLIAGAILASFGGVYVFLANAVLSLAAALIVMRWRSEQKVSVLPGERFVGAMRVGVQYVAQSRPMRIVLARVAVFFLQSTPLLALAPILATRLQGGAGTFTLLLAALGVGAIVAVALLPRLRMRMTRDRMVRDGSIAQAIAMAAVGFAPNVYVALPAMLIAGAAWITVANTLTVSAQLALPDWVRARGMALYQMALMGAAAAGAAIWGHVAEWLDVPLTLAAAAAAGLAALVALRRLSVGTDADIDLTPARLLEEPTPAFPIEHDKGPVLVTIEYEIDPARAEEFVAVMRETRANRLQKGALSWGLFHDISAPNRYLEYFLDESWADHLRRFERMTAADLALRERRLALHVGREPPKVTRYVAESIAR
jgi:MFS family permease/quinol monooxygenase YgiN